MRTKRGDNCYVGLVSEELGCEMTYVASFSECAHMGAEVGPSRVVFMGFTAE